MHLTRRHNQAPAVHLQGRGLHANVLRMFDDADQRLQQALGRLLVMVLGRTEETQSTYANLLELLMKGRTVDTRSLPIIPREPGVHAYRSLTCDAEQIQALSDAYIDALNSHFATCDLDSRAAPCRQVAGSDIVSAALVASYGLDPSAVFFGGIAVDIDHRCSAQGRIVVVLAPCAISRRRRAGEAGVVYLPLALIRHNDSTLSACADTGLDLDSELSTLAYVLHGEHNSAHRLLPPGGLLASVLTAAGHPDNVRHGLAVRHALKAPVVAELMSFHASVNESHVKRWQAGKARSVSDVFDARAAASASA